MLEHAGLEKFTEYTPLPKPEEDYKSRLNLNTNNTLLSASDDDLLYIYPNPVNDILTVEYAFLSNTSVNSIGIYDIKGTLLINVPITDAIGITNIDVTSLSKGNYILSFGDKGVNSFSRKFVVQ